MKDITRIDPNGIVQAAPTTNAATQMNEEQPKSFLRKFYSKIFFKFFFNFLVEKLS